MNQITVRWHDKIVGHMIDSRSDMWFLEGQWRPAPSTHTDLFLARAVMLDARAVITGNQRGLVVTLHYDATSSVEPAVALVIAPPAQVLCVQRVFDARAVALARCWEKEEL